MSAADLAQEILRAARLLAAAADSRSPRMSCSPMTSEIAGLEALLEPDHREGQRVFRQRQGLREGGDRHRVRSRPWSARTWPSRSREPSDQPATMTRRLRRLQRPRHDRRRRRRHWRSRSARSAAKVRPGFEPQSTTRPSCRSGCAKGRHPDDGARRRAAGAIRPPSR